MTDASNKTSATRSNWAWVPVVMLGSMLLGLGSMAYVAIDDPHFALEPNYYDKAVHWDQSRAQARQSALSGVALRLSQPLTTSASGGVEVEVHITDREQSALLGAQVELQAFPNAYAERVEHVTLRESAPGVYSGRLSRAVLGLWELRFDVTREALHFHEILRQDVVKGGAA